MFLVAQTPAIYRPARPKQPVSCRQERAFAPRHDGHVHNGWGITALLGDHRATRPQRYPWIGHVGRS